MKKMMLGYIAQIDTNLNPGRDKFEFREARYTRRINSRGDRIFSKMLAFPEDYDWVRQTTEEMRESSELIIVREPFFLDDALREKALKWVEWANKADPSEYDPFAEARK